MLASFQDLFLLWTGPQTIDRIQRQSAKLHLDLVMSSFFEADCERCRPWDTSQTSICFSAAIKDGGF